MLQTRGTRTTCLLGLATALASPLVAAQERARSTSWTMHLDGKRIAPRFDSLHGDPTTPRAGDVFEIAGYRLVLTRDGRHAFHTEADGSLSRTSKDGSRELVALELEAGESLAGALAKRRKAARANAADVTDPSALRSLRGVRLQHSNVSPTIADRLGGADFEHLLVEVRAGGSRTFPRVPAPLRYLCAGFFDDYRSLEAVRSLRYLSLSGRPTWRPLANKPELRFLGLYTCRIAATGPKHSEGASNDYPNLRSLIIDRSRSAAPLPGPLLASLAKVRQLRLIKSFGWNAIMSAEMPALRTLDTSGSEAPPPTGSTPALRRFVSLRTNSASPSADELRAFERKNPDCVLVTDWNQALHARIDRATRIRVRSRQRGPRIPAKERVVVDEKTVRSLLRLLQVRSENSGSACACSGELSLEFEDEHGLLARISLQHDKALRWTAGPWIGDARLVEKTRPRLLRMLRELGFPGPEREVEDARVRARESAAQLAAWKRATPSALRPFFDDSGDADEQQREAMHTALRADLADRATRIRALLRWIGASRAVGGIAPAYERVPYELLLRWSTRDILAALDSRAIEGALLDGSSRFFGGYFFDQHRKADLALLDAKLKAKLLAHIRASRDGFRIRWAESNFGQ